MPSRKQAPVFEELYAREKERVLDQLARAKAGQEGRPAFSKKPNAQLEAEAWDNTDRSVTDQHFAEIAQATVQELSQEKDEQGMPLWSLEQIDQEVRYRQSMALHPYRSLTYSSGVPDDDYEALAKEAETVARRAQRRNSQPVVDEHGWQLADENDPLPSAPAAPAQPSMTPPQQPQQQQPPAPQQSAAPMEGVAY